MSTEGGKLPFGAGSLLNFNGVIVTVSSVVVLCVLASRYAAFLAERRFRLENGCKHPPAYPQKDPIFALDLVWEALDSFRTKNFLDMITNRHAKMGPTYSARSMTSRYLFTVDPENIKTVLSVKFKDYSLGERSPIMGPLLGRGIFVTDGDEWAHSRAVLRPNFVKDQVADLQLVDKHVTDLMKLVRPHCGSTIDLQPLFTRFTLDSATEFLFGQSTNTLSNPGQAEKDFSQAFQYSLDDIATSFRLGPFWRLRRASPKVSAAHKVCRAYVDRFVDGAVDLRKPAGEDHSRDYFLKGLAQTTSDKDKIRDELLNILIAGRDTAASLLSSLFHALARNPHVWAKIREEVKQFDGQLPTYDQLRDLKYSKYCINETLRLWPPVPSNMRLAIKDTVLPRGGGKNGDEPIFVPKGCAVNYTVFAMHRRTDLFGDDAAQFRPERWEGQTYGWQYLPFNGGPRICLGQQYALTEALVVLTRFAQEFETISARDPEPWTESLHLTVTPHNGVQVELKAA